MLLYITASRWSASSFSCLPWSVKETCESWSQIRAECVKLGHTLEVLYLFQGGLLLKVLQSVASCSGRHRKINRIFRLCICVHLLKGEQWVFLHSWVRLSRRLSLVCHAANGVRHELHTQTDCLPYSSLSFNVSFSMTCIFSSAHSDPDRGCACTPWLQHRRYGVLQSLLMEWDQRLIKHASLIRS